MTDPLRAVMRVKFTTGTPLRARFDPCRLDLSGWIHRRPEKIQIIFRVSVARAVLRAGSRFISTFLSHRGSRQIR